VVAYRSGEDAVRACRSALEQGAEVVLFDNSPGDGTAARVREALPEVEHRTVGRNVGFAAGCNRAAEGAVSDYLLFLNPDAALLPGALERLVGVLDGRPGAGVAGPSLRFPDGSPQPSVRRDPSPAAILHQYTAFRYLALFGRAYRRYRSPPAGEGSVEVLMGSAMLVRTELFRRIGGFDERYFLYFEEADLCRRVRAAGSEVVFVPEARGEHAGGVSAAQEVPRLAAVRLVSAQRYVRRFASPGKAALFRAGFLLGFPLRAMGDLLRDLLYLFLYCLWPPKHGKAARKGLEALASLRLLTVDLFRVAAG
jgi:GT2 family glycosyltransferase